ncbi:PREDICTED: uncharacterized protein LOC109582493 [Amphimedon queenslandica]|uniref:Uncharacterized protein n=1 Tax=Amphimedon queenslandica TaxID=400682 RepID=A0AAN0J7S6_AMPQE|nr:PREDICTED: uncharacterized protein LOC109582493 [Amphimedon queenslandica]|eukprot:XP_019852781.1 PREDICTED: uncharacterized protein LOC109582493 [Amphimedon queenslandica]
MEQSLDLDEFQHQTMGQVIGGARHYSFALFLETREENETFRKYNAGVKISVVDLSSGELGPAKPVRGQLGWTVEELKQHIGELFNMNSSCMRIVMEKYTDISDVSNAGGTLKEILYRIQLLYVSSDPEDYQKEFKDSLMYRIIDFHNNPIRLNITIPPGPEATPTTTNVTEGGIMMKIISINDEEKGQERKIQVQVDRRITLAQLKEELVPLIGVPPTGFRVCEISGYDKDYEMEGLDMTLKSTKSGSELIVRLGRGLRRGEKRIKLYLLQVNNTEV